MLARETYREPAPRPLRRTPINRTRRCSAQVVVETGEFAVELPVCVLGPDAGGVGATHSLSLSRARELLASAFTPWLAAGGGGVPRPTPEVTTPALEAAAAGCPPTAMTAVVAALFLAAGVFARELWPSSCACASAPHGDGGSDGCGGPCCSALKLPGLLVRVHEPSLPVGAGLGSSAAFAVSTAAALLDARRRLADASRAAAEGGGAIAAGPETVKEPDTAGVDDGHMRAPPATALAAINDWAFAAETLFHGAPSGLDNTVATCVQQGNQPSRWWWRRADRA